MKQKNLQSSPFRQLVGTYSCRFLKCTLDSALPQKMSLTYDNVAPGSLYLVKKTDDTVLSFHHQLLH